MQLAMKPSPQPRKSYPKAMGREEWHSGKSRDQNFFDILPLVLYTQKADELRIRLLEIQVQFCTLLSEAEAKEEKEEEDAKEEKAEKDSWAGLRRAEELSAKICQYQKKWASSGERAAIRHVKKMAQPSGRGAIVWYHLAMYFGFQLIQFGKLSPSTCTFTFVVYSPIKWTLGQRCLDSKDLNRWSGVNQ